MKKILIGTSFLLLLAGCLSRPALVHQNFALQNPAVTKNATGSTGATLVLRPCEVSPLFDNRSLIYRTGPNEFETDSYAGFLASPEQTFAAPIRACLAGSGLYEQVAEPDSVANAGQFLQVYVDELYGDFQNPQKPEAVLSLRIVLVDARNNPEKVVLQKEYSRHLPITTNTAAAVVAGWNQALNEIMQDVVSDLTTVK